MIDLTVEVIGFISLTKSDNPKIRYLISEKEEIRRGKVELRTKGSSETEAF